MVIIRAIIERTVLENVLCKLDEDGNIEEIKDVFLTLDDYDWQLIETIEVIEEL